MLRDELLRSKNDEIARCLLSRKRKLSELYFATVGLAGATEGAPADSLYYQKEQAFLDANDLSKGRYFNEATLPPLPDYAAIVARPETKEVALPAVEAVPHAQDVAGVGSSQSVEAIIPPSDGSAVDQQVAEENPSSTTPSTQPKSVSPIQTSAPSVTPQASQGLKDPSLAAVPSARSGPATPLSAQPHDSADAGVSPGRKVSLSVPSRKTPEVSSAHKKHDKRRPSLVLEQPLSPVSSAGPYSVNTPAPVTASPDTSPAEEASEVADQPSPNHGKPVQAPPTLVPSTPDEQLRLEEAQSLQQSTVEASMTIGDAVNGGYPSTNEVIRENVAPTPTAAKNATTTPAQEATPSFTRPEFQKQSGAPEAVKAKDTALPPRKHSEQSISPTATGLKASPSTPTIPEKSHTSSTTHHPVPPPPERMTTRVSSGAIRHKSVSEILGETPRPAASHPEKHTEATKATSTDKEVPESPAKMRFKDRKEREKERTKLSTVVFPKQQQQQQQEKNELLDMVRQNSGDVAKWNEEQDYLFTLFQNKAYTPPRGTNINTLVTTAHKTLNTENHLLEYQEQMDCRTLRRIYALQNANRWPLRQLKRSVEPPRQGTHWDVLLDHMKWMRTDFREERKWKIAAAKSCADWCAEYVHSDEEHRALLRVPAKAPVPKAEATTDQKTNMISPPGEIGDEMVGVSHPTPDLVPSTEDDSMSDGYNDEPRHDLHDTVAPAAIFSLGSDEFTFSLDMTPAAEKLLDELPIYAPVQIAPDAKTPTFKEQPDSAWKSDILPVSKYTFGKISFHDTEPARKRSRYDYSQYESEPEHQILELPPEQTNVALFRPENKHIRDRIHPGHSFRPPTEHPMPSVGFFESRQSSQWTYAEDDELRRLVKEYSYNWSLISSCLTSSSQFASGAERRTPWECFERWIGLEGLPADMSKTQYFRAYHQRLETAQRTVLAQQQAAQQQAAQQQQQQAQQGNVPQPQPPVRRRTTQPVRVDRRRSSKHLALLDAMRKLAKKRETILQKQQHASHLASLRKVNEATQPKPPISSPAEFSRLKYDREMKLQERQEQYRQQMIAQQRANLAAQRAGQMPNQQQQMMNAPPGRNPNGMPHNPGTPGVPGNPPPNGMPNGMPNAVGANQGRPHPMQGMPTGAPVNGAMQPNAMAMKMMPQPGIPQQQQQQQQQQPNGARPGVQMQTSPDNARVIREANRLQEQQRMLQSRQQQPPPHQQVQGQQPQQQFHNQQQFAPQGSHSPNLNNMPNVNGAPNNPAMMAALQANGGMQSPSFHNATPQGVSTPSPRMGQPNPLSSGVVPTISNIQSQIQRSNPNMTPEQVNKLATDRLHQYQQQRMSQVAMNAAAGNIGAVQANYQVPHDGAYQSSPQMNGGPGMQVPQAQGFSPMMRVPQPAQQNRVGVTSSPAMNGAVPVPQQSRSATPQTQRSGSSQAGPVSGPNKSPHPPQAQTATG